MPHDSNWLPRTMRITERHPYQGALVPTGDVQHQIQGIAVFQVENGTVGFKFYVDPFADYQAWLQAVVEGMQGASELNLTIASANFQHPVMVTSFTPSSGENPIKGTLAEAGKLLASSFGTPNHDVERAVVELLDLPNGWGSCQLAYQYATLECPLKFSEDEKHILIPTETLGLRALSGCTINAGGWTAEIREIPSEHRRDQRVTHQCIINRCNGEMTGASAWGFFEEELWPFLCFVFGHKVQVTHMTGDGWAKLRSVRPKAMQTYSENWFLIARHLSIDLQSLFQMFHSQTCETKKHWRKVIDRYAASEEIIATFGDPEIAEAVSFAGLEGLTRSTISGYSDKNQWLNSKLELEPKNPKKDGGKAGIVDAIEMVLKRELGTHNPKLAEPLGQLKNLRNSTVHTDLRSDPDWSDTYYRWKASQALIEILLLAKMGLREIPNRTEYGKFDIMGQDIYKDVRKETILPSQCQCCGEWTGTLIHDECRQNLCNSCREQHKLSGCTDATYQPAQ